MCFYEFSKLKVSLLFLKKIFYDFHYWATFAFAEPDNYPAFEIKAIENNLILSQQ